MATLKDIKVRIRTVSSIRNITRAMQLVAAAKLTRAQERAHTVRPYADEMDAILGALAAVSSDDGGADAAMEMVFAPGVPPIRTTRARLFEQREERRPGVVLLTSDRGLCGAFNSNLVRAAQRFLAEHEGKDCQLVLLGKKGYQFFRRRGLPILYHRAGLSDRLLLPEIKEITGKLVELYVSGEVDALYLIYAKSIRAAMYRVTTQKFLSIPPVEGSAGGDSYILEPDCESLFATLIPLYATTTVFSALADSFACVRHGSLALGFRLCPVATMSGSRRLQAGRLHVRRQPPARLPPV